MEIESQKVSVSQTPKITFKLHLRQREKNVQISRLQDICIERLHNILYPLPLKFPSFIVHLPIRFHERHKL